MKLCLRASSRGDELLDRNARLPQNAGKRAKLQLTMIRHDATGCSAAHNDVATAVTDNGEPEPLEDANRLCARDAGKPRHDSPPPRR